MPQPRGIAAIYDDREERAGVKFKDAELIGIPWRITIGKRLAEGFVELAERKTGTKRDLPPADVASQLASELGSLTPPAIE